jgi:hypothetical protein
MDYGWHAYNWLHIGLVLKNLSCLDALLKYIRIRYTSIGISYLRAGFATYPYLLAEPLYIDLRQLLALHEALDPSVKGWYRRRFRYR